MSHTVEPTGAVHEVGVDELFFSVTDNKGVIESSNRVFVELSRHSREELMSAPHNIIRHPAMPGAVFRILWDTIQTGKPFAGYVRNLAADGSEYDVFATITPLPGNRFLSVRTRPVRDDLFDAALKLYEKVRAYEDQLMADGANRRSTAKQGTGRAGELLAELGFPSYDAFQTAALPAEVSRREELSAGLPTRPDAEGLLREALDTVHGIYDELAVWMREQNALAELSSELRRVANEIEGRLGDAKITPDTIATIAAHGPALNPLVEPLQVWTSMQEIVASTLSRLVGSLRELDETSARTRFLVALARLHTTMLATFVAELIDGGPDAKESVPAIWLLTKSLRQGLYDMEEQTLAHRRLASNTAWNIDQANSMITIPSQVLAMWKATADTMTLPEDVAALVPVISEGVVDYTGTVLKESTELAERCRALGDQHDSTRMKELMHHAEDLAVKIASQ
ncbi:MAG: PAS domain-containing protein [Actinomycetaceae bacterium]|nr:PAS domain-containing protein [Actinomycetaceae bacterium]